MALITRTEAAELAGVAPNTWSSYVARGQAPAPVKKISATSLWRESDVKTWMENRPGRGARSTKRAQQRADARAKQNE